MTGRDLILYILKNNLEDEKIFQDGSIPGFISEEELAMILDVGIETVKVLYKLEMLDGIKIGNTVFFPEK